jgi:hypothetical protein
MGRDCRCAAKDEIVLSCVDPATEARMKEEVEEVSRTGDTVGGVFEVVVARRSRRPGHLRQLGRAARRPAGLVGDEPAGGQGRRDRPRRYGCRVLRLPGPRSHPLRAEPNGKPTRFTRPQNNAGGIEGGVSNGEDIVVRGYLKPISTLRKPLESVRFDTREATSASYERSDICVVPAAGVAAEAMVALTIAAWRSRSSAATRAGNATKFRSDTSNRYGAISKPMILKIVKYPEPVLSQPGEPVTEFNAELRKLVADMFETTYASQGIGLAAPQVGVSKR